MTLSIRCVCLGVHTWPLLAVIYCWLDSQRNASYPEIAQSFCALEWELLEPLLTQGCCKLFCCFLSLRDLLPCS
jgi:hypothetical protein